MLNELATYNDHLGIALCKMDYHYILTAITLSNYSFIFIQV